MIDFERSDLEKDFERSDLEKDFERSDLEKDFERSDLEKDFERSDLLKKGVPHRDALWMNMPLSGRITSRQVS